MLYISGKNNDFLKYGEGLFFSCSCFFLSHLPHLLSFFSFSLIFFNEIRTNLSERVARRVGFDHLFP